MKPIHEFGKEVIEKEKIRIQKNKKMKGIIKIVVLLLISTTVIFLWSDIKYAVASSSKKEKTKSGKLVSEQTKTAEQTSADIVITQKWDLPEILTEISGLAYIDENRFACVQDEQGTIFIYNTATASIEKEIPFAGPGDYEGLTLVNETVWVLRADGHLYEVDNIKAAKPTVKEYSTHLTVKHNTEGLCYDKQNNRLLVAIKDAELTSKDYKGIYSFDLTNRSMAKVPVFKIDLQNAVFGTGKSKKNKGDGIMPSAIGIHPITGDMYVTDGRKAKLLVLDATGVIKKLYQLNSNEFTQPEGITFKPDGNMFISNEGAKKPGNILLVEIANQ